MTDKSLVVFNKTVLRNGLRVVTEKIPTARSVAIGVWVDVGSRDELARENGISHFIEHMLFKGTKTRTAKDIASYLESLGGNLNAFTSREQTCYHAIVLDEHLPQAVEILADLTTNSTLKPNHIQKEKQVVIEEIHEIEENPSDYIHDLFADSFWRGQPLGRYIIGTSDIIESLKRRDIIDYIERHYRTGRIVISAAGNISHKKLLDLVNRSFHFPGGNGNRGEAAVSPIGQDFRFIPNKTTQNHVCIGFPGISFGDPDRYPLLALYTYLGSGMSSVLFQTVREEKGMAYTIYTFTDFYRDNGLFGIYFASDKRHLGQAVELILKELKKVKRTRLDSQKLAEVKAQIKGHLILAMESTSGRMSRIGRQELMTGEYCSLSQALKLIDRIKADDIIEMARRIFTPEGFTFTLLGPGRKKDIANVDLNVLQ